MKRRKKESRMEKGMNAKGKIEERDDGRQDEETKEWNRKNVRKKKKEKRRENGIEQKMMVEGGRREETREEKKNEKRKELEKIVNEKCKHIN